MSSQLDLNLSIPQPEYARDPTRKKNGKAPRFPRGDRPSYDAKTGLSWTPEKPPAPVGDDRW